MPSDSSRLPDRVRAESGSLVVQSRVLRALFIRELMTRYGRNNLGFLWLFLEPMIFTMVVALMRTVIRGILIGNVPIIAFAVSGYATVMMWRNMPGRCIGAVKGNQSLLYHRQVTIPDVYYARMLLEIAGATTSFLALAAAGIAMGLMPGPEDVMKMIVGWLLLAWFGIGLAMVIGALAERWEVFGKFWSPASYLIFPLSGVFFLVQSLPPRLAHFVSYMPMVHSLEYFRDGWFGSTFVAVYDLQYAIVWNIALTFAGLSLVRQIGFDTSSE